MGPNKLQLRWWFVRKIMWMQLLACRKNVVICCHEFPLFESYPAIYVGKVLTRRVRVTGIRVQVRVTSIWVGAPVTMHTVNQYAPEMKRVKGKFQPEWFNEDIRSALRPKKKAKVKERKKEMYRPTGFGGTKSPLFSTSKNQIMLRMLFKKKVILRQFGKL